MKIFLSYCRPMRAGVPRSCAIAAAVSLVMAVPAGSKIQAEEKENPRTNPGGYNVLLISIDDLNDWTGCLGGHPQAKTPNIDRLASEGILFTNAHSPSTACNPSRTAILTGVSPHKSGIYQNFQPFRKSPLLSKFATLPQAFKESGYLVQGSGKIFHNQFPDPQSWNDYWPALEFPRPSTHPFFLSKARDPSLEPLKEELDWGALPYGREIWGDWFGAEAIAARICADQDRYEDNHQRYLDYTAGKVVQLVKWVEEVSSEKDPALTKNQQSFLDNWLRARAEGREPIQHGNLFRRSLDQSRFFLAYGVSLPHAPWYLPQEYFDRFPIDELVVPEEYPGDLDDIPQRGVKFALARGEHEVIKAAGMQKEAIQAYLAASSFVDDCVGLVLDAVEESGHGDDTMIILFSDHGYHLGEKQHWTKFTLWEECTRVPMIWKMPPGFLQGQKVDDPVGLMDIFPTLIDLCDLDIGRSVDGESLKPFLTGKGKRVSRDVLTCGLAGNFGVRDHQFRLIRYDDGSEEFYDHQSDPGEHRNLSGTGEFEEDQARLRSRIPTSWVPASAADPEKAAERKKRHEERLRARKAKSKAEQSN